MKTMVDSQVTKNTTVDWYNFCRDICCKALQNQDVHKIGGVAKIVEINESKLTNKYIIEVYNMEANRCLME